MNVKKSNMLFHQPELKIHISNALNAMIIEFHSVYLKPANCQYMPFQIKYISTNI